MINGAERETQDSGLCIPGCDGYASGFEPQALRTAGCPARRTLTHCKFLGVAGLSQTLQIVSVDSL